MTPSHRVGPALAVLSLASTLALGVTGCVARDAVESTELAAYGDDSLQTESNLESVAQSFVGGSSGQVSIQAALTNPAGGFYQPPGCLVGTSDPSKENATFTFTDCTGPFGLVHLTGVVNVTWSSKGGNELALVLTANDFAVNQATITTWSANATVTAAGDSRTMAWSARLSGTTGSGRAFTRSNDKTIGWTLGGSCLSISGTSTGTVTGLDLQTTLSSYSRCSGACPAAGSEVHVEDLSTGASIDLTYLGGGQAQFTSVRGASTDLPVACGS